MSTVTIQKEKKDLYNLTSFAKDFLKENYNINIDIPIKINNRLKRSMGRLIINGMSRHPESIELAGFLLEYGTNSVIVDTLKHELIHYACFVLGKPYRDGDAYFENELIKHNTTSTETVTVGKYEIMQCLGCGTETETDNKTFINNPQKYYSRCCKSDFKRIGYTISNGEKEYKHYY